MSQLLTATECEVGPGDCHGQEILRPLSDSLEVKRIREEETEEDKKRLTEWLSRTGTLSGDHKAILGPLLDLHNLRMHLEG